MIVVSIICWILAAICNAVMDKLVHHYSTSIFSKCNPQFWNPELSWKNKYKNGQKILGSAFFLSTGILVFLTDGWHLFKSMMIVLLAIALITFPYVYTICIFENVYFNMLIWLGILSFLWNNTFSIFYHNILNK